ncbi:MAG: DUF2085 domain-containing protein [Caldilineaceae bacterium]
MTAACREGRATEVANGLVVWIAPLALALQRGLGRLRAHSLHGAHLHATGLVQARLIYAIYSVFCHQLPDHSYFLYGPDAAPLGPALATAGLPQGLDLFTQRKFIGNDLIGYKVALCQRDVAIYGSVLAAGLLYGLVRDRVRPLSLKVYAILLIPIAVDGLTQMFGLRESNWWLRSVTGAIFGFASVWLAYPYVDEAMAGVIETEALRQAERDRAGNGLSDRQT